MNHTLSFKQFLLEQNSYFDSWKLPAQCEDWRVSHKNAAGQMALNSKLVHDLILKGCKPMGSFDNVQDEELIANLIQNRMHFEVSGSQTFIGSNPEWVKKGVRAHAAQDHIEFGKALGFGEHSVDTSDPEILKKSLKHHQKEKEKYDQMTAAAAKASADQAAGLLPPPPAL
jgi:uncharacterized protein YbcV (DUF1398 family)